MNGHLKKGEQRQMGENTMHMRPSRVLARLRAGKVVLCLKVNLADARVAEIAGISGYDCIWTDMEHVANDWSVIEQQVWRRRSMTPT